MAVARLVQAGDVYQISRRTLLREFRLTPSRKVVQILNYCLAHAALKKGVRVLAYMGMSTHHHPIVQDVRGCLPEFLHLLHMLIAKALNVLQSRHGSLWDGVATSVVRLGTPQDVLSAIGYVVANPITAGLVRRPEDWPGAVHFRRGVVTVRRPDVYFGESFPETLELRIMQPTFADEAPGQWFSMVEGAVREKVREARATVEQSGRKFLGAKRVLRQSIETRATTPEPACGLRPRVASKDSAVRLALIEMERGFQQAYRTALAAWRDGEREVQFPYGTWWMRVHHRARVASGPA